MVVDGCLESLVMVVHYGWLCIMDGCVLWVVVYYGWLWLAAAGCGRSLIL